MVLNDKMTDEMFHQFVNNPSLQLFGHDLEMYLPCSTPYLLKKKKNGLIINSSFIRLIRDLMVAISLSNPMSQNTGSDHND